MCSPAKRGGRGRIDAAKVDVMLVSPEGTFFERMKA